MCFLYATASRACRRAQGPTNAVGRPSTKPSRRLRRDMVTESVSEVWVMVCHGLPHHAVREEAGGVGGQEGEICNF